MDTATLTNGSSITLVHGDLTRSEADAIVNAANAYLTPGGGVSGAIHKAAGPGLAEECERLSLGRGALKPGEAVATGAHDMPSKRVIHVLGPVYTDGRSGEAQQLAAGYRSAVELADAEGLGSIAFPSISTGIFGYPLELAAPIALNAVRDALLKGGSVRTATFVLYDQATFDAFKGAFATMRNAGEL